MLSTGGRLAGIRPGCSASTVPQRTSIAASGAAADVNRLLGITLQDWTVRGRRSVPPPEAASQACHRPSATRWRPSLVSTPSRPGAGVRRHPRLGRAARRVASARLSRRAYEIDPLHEAGCTARGRPSPSSRSTRSPPVTWTCSTPARASTRHPSTRSASQGAVEDPGPGTGEVALDIQVIRGIAPQAQIINYEGPNTADGFAAMIARIVADARGPDREHQLGPVREVQPAQRLARRAARVRGRVRGGHQRLRGERRRRRIRLPARADLARIRSIATSRRTPTGRPRAPSVIGVGGTFLSIREDGTYLSEAGWEEPLSGGGGGGGLSHVH